MGKKQILKTLVSKIKGIFGKENNLIWEGASEKIATNTGKVISPKTGKTIANVEKGFIHLNGYADAQTVTKGINRYRTYIPAEGSPLYGIVERTTTYNSPQIGKSFEAVVNQNGKKVTINNPDTLRTYLHLNRMGV